MNDNIPVPLSCEFFPIRSAEGAKQLATVRRELSFMNCDYFSVTYGAGGSTRERTLTTVAQIHEEGECAVMPHLTCVISRRDEIKELLQLYQQMGIDRIMALRGDMPSGMYQSGDLHNARELVTFIRENWGAAVKIYVAAYPETHPRSKTPLMDLRHFKEKVAAGADEAVTQYFYNIDAFLRFRDECARENITIPIVPGIMPITNYLQLARFSDACGAELPRWIRKRLEALQDDMQGLRDFGADVVSSMCERLIDEGISGLHFYTMNRSDAIRAIASRLNWLEN